ncbi:MAG: hypothetical protein ACXVCJ_26475, partial [Polyangiales bacterium]
EGTVATDSGETVTLTIKDGAVASPEDVKCSCLLSPRCFHVLAVVAALPIGESEGVAEEAPESIVEPKERVALDSAQKHAAKRAREVVADVVTVGASGTGAVLEGELLRVVHDARTAGLHRLAASALRVVRDVRDLRTRSDSFSTPALVDDLRDLVATTRVLDVNAEVDKTWVGVGRRAYEKIGSLRLVGVCTEPVIAKGGYAGVVTHLCDQHGTLYTVGDVRPGGIDLTLGAYDAAVLMGDTTIPHRALGRGGLFVQDATSSSDRRLGAGKDVKAVRASGTVSGLRSEAVRARFSVPLRDQVARAYAELGVPEEERARSAGFVFVRGIVAAYDPEGLWIETEEGGVRLIPPSLGDSLAFLENVRVLARARGLSIEAVGRVIPDVPRSIALLAFGPGDLIPDAPTLELPEEWAGLVNAGYDKLAGANIRGTLEDVPRVTVERSEVFDPLFASRRRVERFALHGTRSLPPEAFGIVDRERRALLDATMHTASTLLGALAETTRKRGVSRPAVADAWLALAAYDDAATISLRGATW